MNWAYLLLIATAPLYVWRFNLLGLPANYLMLAGFFVVVSAKLSMLRKGLLDYYWQVWRRLPKEFLWASLLFFVVSVNALFVGGLTMPKLGQWLVLYLLPMSVFALSYAHLSVERDWRPQLTQLIYLFVALAGALAVLQYFTLLTLPQGWWGNASEPKRAIAFWIHPNGYALFVAPLLAWLLPDIGRRVSALFAKVTNHDLWATACWLLGSFGILLSLSRGAWLGIAAAIAVYTLIAATRKFRRVLLSLVLVVIVAIMVTPNLRYRLVLPFYGEKSAVARLSLWDTAGKMIADAPLIGKGISGFSNNWDRFNTDPNLDHYNFPHNIFLNFWVDLGLIGALAFLFMCCLALYYAWRRRKDDYAFGFGLFVLTMITHGLIDIPYLKNDLALLFWLMFSVALARPHDYSKN